MHTNHEGALAVAAVEPSAIRDEIIEIARMAQHEAEGITASDRQFLKDLQRHDGRYKAVWIARLVRLLAKCRKDSAAFALGERLNAFVAHARPRRRLTIVVAVTERSKEQAEADIALMHAALAQNDPSALRRAESELIDQRGAVDHAIEAVRARRLTLEGALS